MYEAYFAVTLLAKAFANSSCARCVISLCTELMAGVTIVRTLEHIMSKLYLHSTC